jgi:hypothetical protein
MSAENNIKIAKHIGMQETPIGWYDADEVLIQAEQDNTFDSLKFDKSWDWLLAVISAFSLENTRENSDFDELCVETSDAVLENDLVRAYNALVKFINIQEQPPINIDDNRLTKSELKKLSKVLSDIESEAVWMYKKVIGGWAKAEMYDYDDELIDVELKFGIIGEVEYTETFTIDRKTMERIN